MLKYEKTRLTFYVQCKYSILSYHLYIYYLARNFIILNFIQLVFLLMQRPSQVMQLPNNTHIYGKIC